MCGPKGKVFAEPFWSEIGYSMSGWVQFLEEATFLLIFFLGRAICIDYRWSEIEYGILGQV